MSKTKTCNAALEHLHEMLFFVQNCCLEKNFHPSVINKIVVGTEEVLVNIVRYGYGNTSGKIKITCRDSEDKPGILIVIKDRGIEFNPLMYREESEKDLPRYEEDKIIGGYGIFLYSKALDRVGYKRSRGLNMLYLTKYLD